MSYDADCRNCEHLEKQLDKAEDAFDQMRRDLERQRDAAVAVVEKIASLGDNSPCAGVPCSEADGDGYGDVCLVHIAPTIARAAIKKATGR